MTRSSPISIGDPDKVTAWPFPEKITVRDRRGESDPEPPKEAPISLRDFELDTAKKRTALIRERMSPAGALRLPELLEKQRLKYGIPDGFFKSQAVFDRIFVFPIDQFDGEETFAPGGNILRGNTTKLKDLQEGNRGVLISAGLTAADRLMSHGVELGHIITTNKNVPFARRCERLSDGTEMFYLVMREADLAGSETLAEEMRSGHRRIVDIGGDGAYEHQIAVNDNGNWDVGKKISIYIRDEW